MCTVSFVQTSDGLIITSNRDENKNRNASPPEIINIGDYQLSYPIDEKTGGTWIAAKNTGEVAVLLNGAFENHIKLDYYIKSRGFIILDVLKNIDPEKAFDEMNLHQIENFTLILYANKRLIEYRWDGVSKHKVIKDSSKHHIWSSTTLYAKDIGAKREQWFNNWISHQTHFNQLNIIGFHKKTENTDQENGLIINRANHLLTVSITSVAINYSKIKMIYEDLIRQSIKQIELTKIPNEDE